jgi:cyclase
MKKSYCLISLALVVLVASALFARAQEKQAEIKLEAVPVAGTVYMVAGAGGNIGISAGPDGILMIDTGYAKFADELHRVLAGLDTGGLKLIVITHYHGDHTGGNAAFAGEAPILAQANVLKRLSTEQTIRGNKVEPLPKEAWPTVTFQNDTTIHFNGEDVLITHPHNTHSDGDAEIYFTKSNVLHIGDNLFSGMFPFVDLDAGGNVENTITHIGELITKLPKDVKIIPGHGPLSTLDDLIKHRDMMRATSDIIRAKMKEGKSLEEIQKEGLPEQWSAWSWRFIPTEKWIELVYESYSQ